MNYLNKNRGVIKKLMSEYDDLKTQQWFIQDEARRRVSYINETLPEKEIPTRL